MQFLAKGSLAPLRKSKSLSGFHIMLLSFWNMSVYIRTSSYVDPTHRTNVSQYLCRVYFLSFYILLLFIFNLFSLPSFLFVYLNLFIHVFSDFIHIILICFCFPLSLFLCFNLSLFIYLTIVPLFTSFFDFVCLPLYFQFFSIYLFITLRLPFSVPCFFLHLMLVSLFLCHICVIFSFMLLFIYFCFV